MTIDTSTPIMKNITDLVKQDNLLIKKDDVSKKHLKHLIKTDGQYIPIYINENNLILDGQDIVDILESLNIKEVKVIQVNCSDSLAQRKFYLNRISSQTKLTTLHNAILSVEAKEIYELENPSSKTSIKKSDNLKSENKTDKIPEIPCFTKYTSDKLGFSMRTLQHRVELGELFNLLENDYKGFISDLDTKLRFTKNELLKLFKLEKIYHIDFITDVEDLIKNGKKEISKKDFMSEFYNYYNLKLTPVSIKSPKNPESESEEGEFLINISNEDAVENENEVENEDEDMEGEEFNSKMVKDILIYDINKYFDIKTAANINIEQDKKDFDIDFKSEIKYIHELIMGKILSIREAA